MSRVSGCQVQRRCSPEILRANSARKKRGMPDRNPTSQYSFFAGARNLISSRLSKRQAIRPSTTNLKVSRKKMWSSHSGISGKTRALREERTGSLTSVSKSTNTKNKPAFQSVRFSVELTTVCCSFSDSTGVLMEAAFPMALR